MSNQVWARFSKVNNNVETKFRIQEVTSERYQEVLDLFMKYHLPEEPLRAVSGIAKSPEASEEFKRYLLEEMLNEKQQILVCCVDDDKEFKLVGASKMTIIERNAKTKHHYSIRSKELKDFFKLRDSLFEAYNVLRAHDVDAYFADRGLVVDPEFRGMGVAGELLKSRFKVCKATGISLYTGMATAIISQMIAERLGANTVRELNLEDYVMNVGLPYTGPQITVKLMVGHLSEF